MTISKTVQNIILQKTGKTVYELSVISYDEERELIKQKRGAMPVFSKKRDIRKIGRGNPLLARKRIRTIEEVDDRLWKICKRKTF